MTAAVNGTQLYPFRLYGRTSQSMTAAQIQELNKANQPEPAKKKETPEEQKRTAFVEKLSKKYEGIDFGVGNNSKVAQNTWSKPAINLSEELVDKMQADSGFARKMEVQFQNAAEMLRGTAANAAAAGASFESLAVNFDKNGKGELTAVLSENKPKFDYSAMGSYQRFLLNTESAGKTSYYVGAKSQSAARIYKTTAATDAYERVKNSLNSEWAEKPKISQQERFAGVDDAYGRIVRNQGYQRYSQTGESAGTGGAAGIRDALLQKSYNNSFTADPFSYRGGMNYFL